MPPKKLGAGLKKYQFFDSFLIFLICWGLPAVLFVFAIDPRVHFGASQNTRDRLSKMSLVAEDYKSSFGKLPPNLRELVEYSKTINKELSIYDNYGNKITLNHLDPKNWLLRSYGPNTLNKQSRGIHKNIFWAPPSWSKMFANVKFAYRKPPHPFQAVNLLSTSSHDGKYTARIFYNPKTTLNSLVVVKNNLFKEPMYVNEIDNPQEIFWLPTSNHLIFTSNPNFGRQESIQILDMVNLETKSIRIENQAFGVVNDTGSKKFFASIAGVKPGGFFFFGYFDFYSPLTLQSFFNRNNLFEVSLESDGISINKANTPVNSFLIEKYGEIEKGQPLPIQQAWLEMNTSDHKLETINLWQNFALEAKSSPLFPYSLMHLIALYELAANDSKKSGKEKESLTLYGISSEYARALANSSQGPIWLRLSGLNSWEALQSGQATGLSGEK